jgi:hypothetical protein
MKSKQTNSIDQSDLDMLERIWNILLNNYCKFDYNGKVGGVTNIIRITVIELKS